MSEWDGLKGQTLVERLRADKQNCGPDIDRSCECFYQYTMDEAAYALEQVRYSDWIPTLENINILPETLRKYIANLETLCDPAGIVTENTLLRDQMKQLDAMISRLNPTIKKLETDLRDTTLVLEAHRQTHKANLERIELLETVLDAARNFHGTASLDNIYTATYKIQEAIAAAEQSDNEKGK